MTRRKNGAEHSRPARGGDEDDLHLPLPPKAEAEADHYNHHPNYIHNSSIHPEEQKRGPNRTKATRREEKRRQETQQHILVH
jgi:hypothetical protein